MVANWTMANPFRDAIRDVRFQLTQAIDVTDELLGKLRDNGVITDELYEQITVSDYSD